MELSGCLHEYRDERNIQRKKKMKYSVQRNMEFYFKFLKQEFSVPLLFLIIN